MSKATLAFCCLLNKHVNTSIFLCFAQAKAVDNLLQSALQHDSKHDLFNLIKSLSPNDLARSEIHHKVTFSTCCSLFYYDAVNCVAAILAGEADDFIPAQYLLNFEKNIPLHGAAASHAPRVAAFLIDNGFSPNLRTDFKTHKFDLKSALPLNVSLQHYRAFHWETSAPLRKSAISFIALLCSNMYRFQRTVRLLARNTKEIKHEFFKYLKEGKLVEVGPLLALASDLITSSSTPCNGVDGAISFNNIREMHQFLSAEKSSLSSAVSHPLEQTQLMEMEETLRLLHIFDRIGDKLVAHMHLGDPLTRNPIVDFKREASIKLDASIKVASLIEDAGFDVKTEDLYRTNYPRTSIFRSFQDGLFFEKVLKRGLSDESASKDMKKKLPPSWLKDPLPLPKKTSVLPCVAMGGASTEHSFFKEQLFISVRQDGNEASTTPLRSQGTFCV